MIKSPAPEIDVAALMETIREEVRQRRGQAPMSRHLLPCAPSSLEANVANLEALIGTLEGKCQVRTKLPRALDRFPINRIALLQRVILKLYELLLREQRTVNLYLIQALREALIINRNLKGDVIRLESAFVDACRRMEVTQGQPNSSKEAKG